MTKKRFIRFIIALCVIAAICMKPHRTALASEYKIPMLQLDTTYNTTVKTDTIALKYKIMSRSNEALDLSKLQIRYYFMKDSQVAQQCFIDYAAITKNYSPLYVSITSMTETKIQLLNSNQYNAATSFFKGNVSIEYGDIIEIQLRICNVDWSLMDQSNDLSYQNKDNVALIYNGYLLSKPVVEDKEVNLYPLSVNDMQVYYTGQPAEAKDASILGNPVNNSSIITYTYYIDSLCNTKTNLFNSGTASDGGAPVNIGTYYYHAVYTCIDPYTPDKAWIWTSNVAKLAIKPDDEIEAVKSILNNKAWNIPQAIANSSTTLKGWIEKELKSIDLRGVSAEVSIDNVIPAIEGNMTNQKGSNGSFKATIRLSKAYVSYNDFVIISDGIVAATAYTIPEVTQTPTSKIITPEIPPEPAVPATGDNTPITRLVVIMAASCVCIILVIIIKKKASKIDE